MAEIPSAQRERSSGLARNCPNLGKAKQRAQTQALPRNLKVIPFLARFSQPMVVLFSPYHSHLHSSKKKNQPSILYLSATYLERREGLSLHQKKLHWNTWLRNRTWLLIPISAEGDGTGKVNTMVLQGSLASFSTEVALVWKKYFIESEKERHCKSFYTQWLNVRKLGPQRENVLAQPKN